jgi:hypothetical protein
MLKRESLRLKLKMVYRLQKGRMAHSGQAPRPQACSGTPDTMAIQQGVNQR